MPTLENRPMVNITLNIPDSYDQAIVALKSLGITPSRSEFIRNALREELREELEYIRDLDKFHEIIANHPIINEVIKHV